MMMSGDAQQGTCPSVDRSRSLIDKKKPKKTLIESIIMALSQNRTDKSHRGAGYSLNVAQRNRGITVESQTASIIEQPTRSFDVAQRNRGLRWGVRLAIQQRVFLG
jgi:hypothetical protein